MALLPLAPRIVQLTHLVGDNSAVLWALDNSVDSLRHLSSSSTETALLEMAATIHAQGLLTCTAWRGQKGAIDSFSTNVAIVHRHKLLAEVGRLEAGAFRVAEVRR